MRDSLNFKHKSRFNFNLPQMLNQAALLLFALLFSFSLFAQERKSLVKTRSDENLPPRKFAQIDSVIKHHKIVLEECYQQAVAANPDLNGRVILRFSISPEGVVKDIVIPRNDLTSQTLDDCLLPKLRRMIFTPTSSKQGVQIVDVPFNFSTNSE
jgi:TonB family protein